VIRGGPSGSLQRVRKNGAYGLRFFRPRGLFMVDATPVLAVVAARLAQITTNLAVHLTTA
jgi:hypothetical protein